MKKTSDIEIFLLHQLLIQFFIVISFLIRWKLGFLFQKDPYFNIYQIGLLISWSTYTVYLQILGGLPGRMLDRYDKFKARLKAIFAVTTQTIALDYFLLDGLLSRGALVIALLLVIFLESYFWKSIIEWLDKWGRWRQPCVLVGDGPMLKEYRAIFSDDKAFGLEVKQEIGSSELVRELTSIYGAKRYQLEECDQLQILIRTRRLCLIDPPNELLSQINPFASRHGITVLSAYPSISLIGRYTEVSLRGDLIRKKVSLINHPLNKSIKTLIDYFLSICILLVASPILILALLAVMILDPKGNPIFSQNRVGLDGKSIKVFKIRTMYEDGDAILDSYLSEHPEKKKEYERYHKLDNDPRIIRGCGRFLRKFSIDELPQLFNVLLGDMSLVGPRPLPPKHHLDLTQDVRYVRTSVKPGITGLWQIEHREDTSASVMTRYDMLYIYNWRPLLDFFVIFETIFSLTKGR
jgi:lipopolysaccharide/colanic/teichoic acid biosynthesis glycosyltransferase